MGLYGVKKMVKSWLFWSTSKVQHIKISDQLKSQIDDVVDYNSSVYVVKLPRLLSLCSSKRPIGKIYIICYHCTKLCNVLLFSIAFYIILCKIFHSLYRKIYSLVTLWICSEMCWYFGHVMSLIIFKLFLRIWNLILLYSFSLS